MFTKILIANRGEIACRIMRTAKSMGIKTVAVFSTADERALHVTLADEAYLIGEAPSKESYLNISKIIAVAKEAQVDAIHPGYGFLSENPEFATACKNAGIIFIGPSPQVMTLMANKNAAKEKMQAENIPILPGFYDEQQSLDVLLPAAKKIGFPVVLKAVAGGGGKGLRLVHQEDEFESALHAVKREAKAFFNDDRVMVEKYLAKARHIEVQIIADQHGHTNHLYTRDCSIQRRHQKIIEEAPAPNLDIQLQNQICAAAVKAAQSIGYSNVGTIEFLVEQNQFYFMEMNTRLQVEHPVTEMIAGLDIVEWQIRIAQGETLFEEQPNLLGHAIEVRLNAEDPDKDFLPSSGKLTYFKLPFNATTRIDCGYQQGDQVNIYYDSLLAKLIVWGKDRTSTLQILQQQLNKIEVLGIKTNLALVKSIIANNKFIKADFDTHFLQKDFIYQPVELSADVFCIAAIFIYTELQLNRYPSNGDPHSPWNTHNGWQLFNGLIVQLQLLQNKSPIKIAKHDELFSVTLNDHTYQCKLLHFTKLTNAIFKFELLIDDKYQTATICKTSNKIEMITHQQLFTLDVVANDATHLRHEQEDLLTSPMPGTVVALHVSSGQKVMKGDKLLVIEAMKMEHTLFAPREGLVKKCNFKIGDLVKEGTELLELE